ncbi:FkbM family methyltransferase [Cylindrospermopsis raciborskii]|uniref:FkbM family methyltransferase n=2 Tax=Cylindrospermopsis raciborskii TaxID=77022 RepID=A0A853MFE9_9CYAN|nr:FkbM family methyltransferase [Cylindrospermopsis raciborskii]EFA70531.1 hypothetical protein CRC_01168 [Cylindrospermopsis raciborskii CS-505]OBU77679.1 FkbM family methyltransferase [Cylindrospermopsis raciborskii CS-505]OHY34123.1 FkbM family methyltransferase [Cylindrospermopsis raciborskii CS-508]PNJ90506.1 FkbM family methyltransferase [Cylindrospermopsis raciborskii C04]PNJ91921.1 FkbM family methyltransferase [Cylindrospermopsis raciborskii C07]
MAFPTNDKYWNGTVDFLKSVIAGEDRIIAPNEFKEKLDNVFSYSLTMGDLYDHYSWIVIHKGMMETLEYSFLETISEKYAPVFANEVFVIFTNKPMKKTKDDNSHLKPFWEKMKSLGKSVRDKLSPVVRQISNDNSIYFNIKEICVSTRKELEKNSRNNSQAVYIGDNVVLCRVLTKYICYVDSQDLSLTPHMCLNGYWESWITQAMIRVLEKGFYCLDIGANCGYYSLIMADIASESGRVAAVEANPRLASLLTRSLAVNGFQTHSQVVQKAVSNTSGEKVNLVVPKSGYLGDATIAGLAEMAGDSVAEVETITVDELTKDWPRVDLIKIDAEGAEDSIWSGMEKTISRNQDIIIIMEFCSDRGHSYRGYDPRTFLETIEASGFSIQHIDYDSKIKPLGIEDCLNASPGAYWDLFLQRK